MIKHISQLSYRLSYLRTASNRFILSYSGLFLEKIYLRKHQYSYMNISMIKHTSQLSYRVAYLRTASNRFILSYNGPFMRKSIYGNTNIATLIFHLLNTFRN